ncbi:uncharacterized protein LOC143052069 [Mytilus galloprovincialis]|uniref:uncharacterized protein LOC143052069 n=1 Tax=Mytilus galloprovincialis TaxID=29158 RepID=UPI003F7BE319
MKIGLIVLVLFNAFCNAFSYWNMRCPSQSEWGVISSWVCNGTETKKYTCLYNAIRRQYEESCKFQPVISGNGSQYVISVYPNSEPCRNYDRYQPFPLGSNAGSDCVFQKSTCSEEGNILFHHGSPKTDLSCRCNFQKGFGFVNEIPNRCDCIPSQEDCSCYLKQCPLGHRLISDYACLHEDDRKHIVKCPEMGPENSRKMTTHLRQLSSKELKNIEFLNRRIDFIGLTCLTGICIVYAIVASLLIITNKIPKMCYIDILKAA